MTEQRPGRKALFVGAPAPAGRSSPDEIAERVRGLNEDLALALKGAAANKAVKTLDASHFGSEYTTLVDAVNAALSKIAAATPGVPAPAGTQPEGTCGMREEDQRARTAARVHGEEQPGAHAHCHAVPGYY